MSTPNDVPQPPFKAMGVEDFNVVPIRQGQRCTPPPLPHLLVSSHTFLAIL